MRILRRLASGLIVTALWAPPQMAAGEFRQQPPPDTIAARPSIPFDQVLDRVINRESQLLRTMRRLHPVLETYIQKMRPDVELGAIPAKDVYFLGKLDLSNGLDDHSLLARPKLGRRVLEKLTQFFSFQFKPLGFAQMLVLDDSGFDRQHYNFQFVRREFLGDIRCLVMDVAPLPHAGKGRFIGRIWVEDREYNIVRFNGTYSPQSRGGTYVHFDSWRLNLQPGLWLPAYVYNEESDMPSSLFHKVRMKAQTRLWGYDVKNAGRQEEFTQIQVDSDNTIRDRSESAQDATPVQGQRSWELMAENNVIERLQAAALVASGGEVEKVLETVVNNLEVTNNLSIQPEVRCRVLLTTPLESFTLGHTIVVSRGLLDVLPDEASLAMVLAHELAHIVLGHPVDTKYAFSDRLLLADETIIKRFDFKRDRRQEEAADTKALELLSKSPYRDKLNVAGLFLKALQARAPELPNLIRPHLGDAIASSRSTRLASVANAAPQLEMRRTSQIAALPLGGRIRLDPWSDKIELVKTKAEPLMNAREKMPFEVTPFFPYLTRVGVSGPAQANVH